MICAVTNFQQRTNSANRSALLLIVAYRKKGNSAERAVDPFPMAQQWRNGAGR
jgi:hypothetical protein